MSTKKATKALRIAELERMLREARAAQVHNYHFADATVEKASMRHLTASGVILTLTALGGLAICDPVLILDGLSTATIEALKADLRRSFDLATLYKPKEVK